MSNGLPVQSSKISQPPTTPVVTGGFGGLIGDFVGVVSKTVDSLTPAADAYFRYTLARQTIKQQNALASDGSYPQGELNDTYAGGILNGNNQTLLVIAGLAAAAVAVMILAK